MMNETHDKLKSVTKQLERVIKENKEAKQEYHELEKAKLQLVNEQNQLSEVIEQDIVKDYFNLEH